jgi:hypothetical protein
LVEIYLYLTYDSWYREKPDATIKGNVTEKGQNYLEILDENNYTQMLMLDKFFAITYNKGDRLY